MKATCPSCGNYGPLETFLVDDDAKGAVITVAKLPDSMHRIIWTYLGLFRKPGANRVLTWSRVGRIVSELSELMDDPETQWKGQRVVPNSPQYWVEAMRAVIDRDAQGKLERPLDGHNYLRAIAYELAEKAWHQGNVTKEKQAQYRNRHCEKPGSAWESSTKQSMDGLPRCARNDGIDDQIQAKPLSEGLKNWRERLGHTEE